MSMLVVLAVIVVAGGLVLVWTIRRRSWRRLGGLVVLGLVFATASAWLYTRRDAPRLPGCAMPARAGELGSICGFDRPEDLELIESRNLVIASEERSGGRLMGLAVDRLADGPFALWPNRISAPGQRLVGDDSCPPPDAATFSPQGVSVSDRSGRGGPIRVAVVAHGGSETLQFFDLVDDPPHLRWCGCIFYPPQTTGNDVALFDDDSLVATNFLPRGSGPVGDRARLRGSLGLDTGDVLAWSTRRGWTHVANTSGAMPNGIIAARDASEFYFADAGQWRVAVVPYPGVAGAVTRIRVGGAPDNLTITHSGHVLATVVTLSGDLPFLCALNGRECRLGWAVWEIDPKTRVATKRLEDDGRRLASATTALEVGNYLLIGTMVDDRIGVYQRD